MSREQETIFDQYMFYSGRRDFTPAPALPGTKMLVDLPYLNDDGQVRLSDLVFPQNVRKPYPVILDVHGGGWVYGSKEINRSYASHLASKGFAVLVIDYTPAIHDDLIRQVKDVLAAMTWLKKNAAQYSLDTDRVFLCGDSAGAHLALLSYIVGRSETLRLVYGAKPQELEVKAFGLVSPVTDLRFFTDSVQPLQRKFRKRLFGDNYAESPLRYCTSIADVLRTVMHLPSVYIVSSEDDFFRNQSVQLHHVLTRRNVENQLRYYPAVQESSLPHSFPVLHPYLPESKAVNDEMLAFFRSHS
ncbi:MAG: alpha/beta hydrolase [Clostridia bacterium]|nr:alpha/beta hydrolase [Clostridia bacterium]